MTGAEALLRTLAAGGIDLYLANPGTSEMHLVEALDRVPSVRPVLGLFEGVLSGAADGYARMSGKPAMTLFHLGPGFANALANLHNARRAHVPMVNVIGDHAVDHLPKDSPLTSDIESLARPMSGWVKRNASAATLARDGAEALAASWKAPGTIATLIVPADSAWGEGHGPAPLPDRPLPRAVPADRVRAIGKALAAGQPMAILCGDSALLGRGLRAAGRIAAKLGGRVLCPTLPWRVERGAGRVRVERIPYFPEHATAFLAGLRHLVLAGAPAPVSFFGYPTISTELLPQGCTVHTLAAGGDDPVLALEALEAELGAGRAEAVVEPKGSFTRPDGAFTPTSIAQIISALLPENAIVSDEGATWSLGSFHATAGAAPHDWIFLTGGAIGQGLPAATGAALACPDRKVLSLEGDGSGMYTVQALWTQARENLDVTTVVFSNRAYAILGLELQRMADATPSDRTGGLIDLGRPDLDWVSLAKGFGVPGERVDTLDGLHAALARALPVRGPRLIEVMLPKKPGGA